MKDTKKTFVEILNKEAEDWKNGKYGNRVRGYGDYLYSQDKILFDIYYQDWLTTL